MSKDYAFTVSGCDDSTFLVLNLYETEADVLRKFTESVSARSSFGCQPTIVMREATTDDIEKDNEMYNEAQQEEAERKQEADDGPVQ